ncbi:MAG: QueT transporter family protein [Bacillota bacterium]
MNKTYHIVVAAIIAAVYFVLTYIFAPISFLQVQVRISEALTILPVFTAAAVPGLFVGCLISNLLMSTLGPIDVIFGSLATLTAALMTYFLRNRRPLAPLPPVLVNAVVIGLELHFILGLPLLETMAYIGLGQFAACYMLGYPLMLLLSRHKNTLFPQK